MKAVLTAERPSGPGWVFERKLDGIRCLAVKDGGRTRLYSRNELSLNDRYAGLAAALDADRADRFVIDGEGGAVVGGRVLRRSLPFRWRCGLRALLLRLRRAVRRRRRRATAPARRPPRRPRRAV